jgi:hypothetical protein
MMGVTLAQSSSSTTVSPGSSLGDTTNESTLHGNGIVGQFWTSVAVQFPTKSDDVPKTVEFARPVSETASR